MTQSQVLEQAKQGDPQAIAALMNKSLQPKGMMAHVQRLGDELEVILQADRVPNRQALTAFVEKGIQNLGVESIRAVRILGWQTGADVPAWEQELSLGDSASIPEDVIPVMGGASMAGASVGAADHASETESALADNMLADSMTVPDHQPLLNEHHSKDLLADPSIDPEGLAIDPDLLTDPAEFGPPSLQVSDEELAELFSEEFSSEEFSSGAFPSEEGLPDEFTSAGFSSDAWSESSPEHLNGLSSGSDNLAIDLDMDWLSDPNSHPPQHEVEDLFAEPSSSDEAELLLSDEFLLNAPQAADPLPDNFESLFNEPQGGEAPLPEHLESLFDDSSTEGDSYLEEFEDVFTESPLPEEPLPEDIESLFVDDSTSASPPNSPEATADVADLSDLFADTPTAETPDVDRFGAANPVDLFADAPPADPLSTDPLSTGPLSADPLSTDDLADLFADTPENDSAPLPEGLFADPSVSSEAPESAIADLFAEESPSTAYSGLADEASFNDLFAEPGATSEPGMETDMAAGMEAEGSTSPDSYASEEESFNNLFGEPEGSRQSEEWSESSAALLDDSEDSLFDFLESDAAVPSQDWLTAQDEEVFDLSESLPEQETPWMDEEAPTADSLELQSETPEPPAFEERLHELFGETDEQPAAEPPVEDFATFFTESPLESPTAEPPPEDFATLFAEPSPDALPEESQDNFTDFFDDAQPEPALTDSANWLDEPAPAPTLEDQWNQDQWNADEADLLGLSVEEPETSPSDSLSDLTDEQPLDFGAPTADESLDSQLPDRPLEESGEPIDALWLEGEPPAVDLSMTDFSLDETPSETSSETSPEGETDASIEHSLAAQSADGTDTPVELSSSWSESSTGLSDEVLAGWLAEESDPMTASVDEDEAIDLDAIGLDDNSDYASSQASDPASAHSDLVEADQEFGSSMNFVDEMSGPSVDFAAVESSDVDILNSIDLDESVPQSEIPTIPPSDEAFSDADAAFSDFFATPSTTEAESLDSEFDDFTLPPDFFSDSPDPASVEFLQDQPEAPQPDFPTETLEEPELHDIMTDEEPIPPPFFTEGTTTHPELPETAVFPVADSEFSAASDASPADFPEVEPLSAAADLTGATSLPDVELPEPDRVEPALNGAIGATAWTAAEAVHPEPTDEERLGFLEAQPEYPEIESLAVDELQEDEALTSPIAAFDDRPVEAIGPLAVPATDGDGEPVESELTSSALPEDDVFVPSGFFETDESVTSNDNIGPSTVPEEDEDILISPAESDDIPRSAPVWLVSLVLFFVGGWIAGLVGYSLSSQILSPPAPNPGEAPASPPASPAPTSASPDASSLKG